MNLRLNNVSLHNKKGQLFHITIMNGTISTIEPMNDTHLSKDAMDLEGQYLLPGFNDSHLHMMGLGTTLMQCSLVDCQSVDDVVNTAKKYLVDHPLKNGEPFVARGWNEDNFKIQKKPTRADLDKISTKNPIVFRRACGHMLVANSAAIQLLSGDFSPVEGGHFDLLTGHFEENAMDLILNTLPLPSLERIKEYILAAQDYLLSLGITSVGSDDLCVYPPSINERVFEAFQALGNDNLLKVRVYEQSLFRTKEILQSFINKGYKMGDHNGLFINGPLKILLDGSLGARTAYLNKPYHDKPSTQGIIMYQQEELNDYIQLAHNHHLDVAIHCIGDGALDMALNAFEHAIENHNFEHRHSIVHCQITRQDQHQRMQDLKIGALAQPIFIDYDHRIVEDRVGKDLASTSYAFNTLKKMDLAVAYGSDSPVEDPNPLMGMYCAITRKGLRGDIVFNENEAVSFDEAMKAFSQIGAHFMHLEDTLGSIEVGMIADLCCIRGLDIDNPLSLLSAKNILTIASGKVVYKE